MNFSSSPFLRKIIYISAIGILLIPLSLISRPEIRNKSGGIEDAGGRLAQLREEHDLSQAKLSEIDPASETMKLASLGLRGVAVNMLWMQAMEHKKTENYDQLASTLKALTKIQPNFVKVWEYQAHNLAYNVSMEFDDYEYRYHWVKKGISFLKDGLAPNKTDHRMTDNLGFFTGNKMGKSDEKDSFRRLFRQDKEFHDSMADYIEPETYETREYGPDSWKMAYQWYDHSRRLVEQSNPQRISDMMFFMYRPAQLRNQGASLQKEYRSGEVIQEIWATANDEWLDYGQEPISNTLGIEITMEGMMQRELELERLRKDLDELVPGVRDKMIADLKSERGFSDEMLAAWKTPVDQRNDEQIVLARKFNLGLAEVDAQLDAKIGLQAKKEDQLVAKQIVNDIERTNAEIYTIDKDSHTINYNFWKARTAGESDDIGIRARQALYDAQEMQRKSIYDDEFDRDFKTGKVTITKRGALTLYEDAFQKWFEVLEKYPDLKDGGLADRLVDSIKEYQKMLHITNRDWPDDFPLQVMLDRRSAEGEMDELPTTQELAELRSATEEDRQEILDLNRARRYHRNVKQVLTEADDAVMLEIKEDVKDDSDKDDSNKEESDKSKKESDGSKDSNENSSDSDEEDSK